MKLFIRPVYLTSYPLLKRVFREQAWTSMIILTDIFVSTKYQGISDHPPCRISDKYLPRTNQMFQIRFQRHQHAWSYSRTTKTVSSLRTNRPCRTTRTRHRSVVRWVAKQVSPIFPQTHTWRFSRWTCTSWWKRVVILRGGAVVFVPHSVTSLSNRRYDHLLSWHSGLCLRMTGYPDKFCPFKIIPQFLIKGNELHFFVCWSFVTSCGFKKKLREKKKIFLLLYLL